MSAERPDGPGDRGLTVIEALAALVLLMMLAVLIDQSLISVRGFDSQFRQNRQAQADWFNGLNGLRQDFQQIFHIDPTTLGTDTAIGEFAFFGERTFMLFARPSADSASQGGYLKIEAEILLDDGTTQIALRRQRGRVAGLADSALHSRQVITSIEPALFFAYLAIDEEGDPSWQTEFADIGELPKAVAITSDIAGLPNSALMIIRPRSLTLKVRAACAQPPCA